MNSDNLKKMKALATEDLPGAVWLWYSTDGSDRLFDLHISDKYSSPTFAFLTEDDLFLLVSTLDADIDSGIPTRVYSGQSELTGLLQEAFQQENWPGKVFLNFSESGDHKVDSLGHGVFQSLTNRISKLYEKNKKAAPQFLSAEELFYSLVERRSELQISRMQVAAERAVDIIRSGFSSISQGMSEHEIAAAIQNYMEATSEGFCKQNGITSETYSWNKDACPIVLVGPNLAKGGHADTSDYRIQPGETIYADFGVKLMFDDGGTVSSDLQRMAYLPHENEENPPSEVQKVFDTLVSSIDSGIKAAKANVFGYEVDEIVRSGIVDAGFPNYDHSTGHPIGEVAHNPGTLIGIADNPRAQRTLKNFGTYTIEPRCQVPNGGSIEEMILVTSNGGRTLCDPQTTLWIVGRNI